MDKTHHAEFAPELQRVEEYFTPSRYLLPGVDSFNVAYRAGQYRPWLSPIVEGLPDTKTGGPTVETLWQSRKR